MKNKIYKYELKQTDNQVLEIKGFVDFLKVAEQDEKLYAWCIVNTLMDELYTAEIIIIGTGHEISRNMVTNKHTHFDSVIMSSGLVWHIFIT